MLHLLFVLLYTAKAAPQPHNTSSSQPNVIFIFVDDLGYNDVGYHNSEILTPVIDILSKHGVRLEQHYALPQCAPSRASFMTGRYPIHTGFQNGNILKGELWGLGLHEFTIAEMFKEYGYSTHAVGKWHLGWRTWDHTPTKRGFDTFLGFYFCAHDHYEYTCGDLAKKDRNFPSEKSRDDTRSRDNSRDQPMSPHHATLLQHLRARRRKMFKLYKKTYKPLSRKRILKLLKESAKKKNTSPNGEAKKRNFDLRENWLDANNNVIDNIRYDLRGKYSSHVFTDEAIKIIQNKEKDKPFFMYLNFMGVHTPLQAPNHYVKRYGALLKNQPRSRQLYAAMINSIDEGIGNITMALAKEGQYSNTVIVFASDNGANVGSCNGEIKVKGLIGGSNYPLRGGKRSVYEGGIRSVSFVHSPLLVNPGRVEKDLVHIVDWFSTFEDLISAGYKIEKSNPSKRTRNEVDSVSAWPLISKGASGYRNEFLVNINDDGNVRCGPQHPFRAIRRGRWKLIKGDGGPHSGWYHPNVPDSPAPPFKKHHPQLYDIDVDPYERNDVARKNPLVVVSLLRALDEYAKSQARSLLNRNKKNIRFYVQSNVPTPLNVTHPLNNELMFNEPYLLLNK